jgi:hypothetical protein
VTDSRKPSRKGGGQPTTPGTSPAGPVRAGRRETSRRRPPEQTTLQRFRTPILVIVVIAAVVGVGLAVFSSAAQPAYACSTVDTPLVDVAGELGQIQPDQGNGHVQAGDKVTYPVCPPASGKHINKPGYGPLEPKVYGPEDQSLPNGWIHNLEHGGLVLLYSCDKGACDAASVQALRDTASGFPTSAICGLPAGVVGPVVARFEQMPTRFAALVWDRALYLDTLDSAKIYDFYLRYGERVSDGRFVAPPEPQCAVPSASPSAGASAEPSPSGS